MIFTVYGILAPTGTNTELGSYRSLKKATESLATENSNLYPVMVITVAERKGTGLLTVYGYYWDANDQYIPWFVSCLLWAGHKLGYAPYEFNPLRNEVHGRQFWSYKHRADTIKRIFKVDGNNTGSTSEVPE